MRLFVYMLLLILNFLILQDLHAGNEREEDAEEIAKELKSTKKRLEEEDKFRRKVMSSLYGINSRVKKMSERKTELTNKMLSTKSEVSSLARQIAQLEKKIVSQRSRLSKYLRAAYVMRGQSSIQALLEADSLKDFDRTLSFLKFYAERDYKAIQEYRINVKLLQAKRENLNQEVQNLVSLKTKVQKQEENLTSEQDSKMNLLAKLRAERKKQISRMKKLRKKGQEIESEVFGSDVLELLEVSIYEKKGQIQPPVIGPIVQGFGLIKDEEYRFKIAHKGLFFNVPVGSEVRSIFKGKVVFADFLEGFGKAVLLDHGDHYYSIYSYNSDIKVSLGEKVQEGQVVALSGSGSQHFGKGLYLEIRHFSEAIDPLPWLKANPDFQARSL